MIAPKFLEADTPVIAIEVPHLEATCFGADNYNTGLIGGKALSRWAHENWIDKAEQLMLIALPNAGSLLELRPAGLFDGMRSEIPKIVETPMVRLNGQGGSVAYFPERYGDELSLLALNILQKKPVPSAIFVKHQFLTPRNVDLSYPLDKTNSVGNEACSYLAPTVAV